MAVIAARGSMRCLQPGEMRPALTAVLVLGVSDDGERAQDAIVH